MSKVAEKNYCLISNDVETHSIWFNELRDETGLAVYNHAMPKILELYKTYDIKATFFYTGEIAQLIPEVVKMVIKDGHEIGCHGLVHEVDQAFDVLTLEQQISHLKKAKAFLEDITGQEVISFRAPALRVNKYTPAALEEAGFKIDSSISPQRLDLFLSFGSMNKFQRLLSPRTPYIAKRDNLARRGSGQIVEIPLSSFILPLVGSTMRAFPKTNTLLSKLLILESKKKNTPIVTYLHPNEFIDESAGALDKVPKRTDNIVQYLLADIVRRKIKMKNLGPQAFHLYENQIKLFKDYNYEFPSMKEYCRIKNLI